MDERERGRRVCRGDRKIDQIKTQVVALLIFMVKQILGGMFKITWHLHFHQLHVPFLKHVSRQYFHFPAYNNQSSIPLSLRIITYLCRQCQMDILTKLMFKCLFGPRCRGPQSWSWRATGSALFVVVIGC